MGWGELEGGARRRPTSSPNPVHGQHLPGEPVAARRHRTAQWQPSGRGAPRRPARAVRLAGRPGRPGPAREGRRREPHHALQFLKPDQVLNGRLDNGPFVFLNACQVGSDKRVLADNGGFASTLLQIGATGVDGPALERQRQTAAEFAREFYAATWTATGEDGGAAPVSAAEAVRSLRAKYTSRPRRQDPRRRRDADRLPGVRSPAAAARPRLTRPTKERDG